MYLSALKLTNYRNFELAEFVFDKSKTIVCADNARGKSNLLEAIYFLAIAKSGRGSRDRDVLRWEAEYFSIDAVVEREDRSFPIRIAYDRKVGKKKAFLESTPLPRLSGLIGAVNAVLFSPEDVDLVLREPPQRRRLLDILVSQCQTSYLADLEQYRRVLSQRNRLLREGQGRAVDIHQLAPWDVQLAEFGARIIRHRLDALDEMQPAMSKYYHRISSSDECIEAVYRSPVKPLDRDRGQEILNKELQQRRGDEVGVGYTLVGPHRDNLVFMLDGKAAHQFASKGQLKSVLLSWKLAEAIFLESQTERRPILLMDDIFSELDRHRAEAAMELVTTFGQIVLTSARDPDLDFEKKGFQRINL